MLVGKSKSVYTRLIIIYPVSQVKITVKQLTTAILKISGDVFIFQQDSAQAHRVRETISFVACNLAKCWLVLNFLQHTQQ